MRVVGQLDLERSRALGATTLKGARGPRRVLVLDVDVEPLAASSRHAIGRCQHNAPSETCAPCVERNHRILEPRPDGSIPQHVDEADELTVFGSRDAGKAVPYDEHGRQRKTFREVAEERNEILPVASTAAARRSTTGTPDSPRHTPSALTDVARPRSLLDLAAAEGDFYLRGR